MVWVKRGENGVVVSVSLEPDGQHPDPADPADPEAQQRCAADVAFSDEVQAEDADICIAVQQGLASGGYSAGRLNPRWENAVHHFHELLRAAYAAGRPVTDA